MKDLMDEIQDVLDMVVNCLDKGEYAIENKNIQKIISRNLFSNIKNIDRILNWYPGPIMAYSDKCLELTDGLFKNTYVNKRKAQELIKYGCTLEFDFINMYDMKINRYVNAVSRIIGLAPNAHKKVVSYYSVKGGGLPIHFDAYSNIIMQVDGYKTWRLSRNNSVLLPLEHYELNDSYKGSDELQSYWGGDIPHELYEVTLKPGDFLILPRGVWHGTTASEYSYSINITISEPTWLDAILNEVRRKLITESMYRKPYRMKDMVTGNINTDLGRINITPKQSDIHEQYLITNKIVRTALKNLTKSFNEGC